MVPLTSPRAIRAAAIPFPSITLLAVASLSLLGGFDGSAAISSWTGQGLSASWTVPGNWSLNRTPGVGSDLTFPSGAARLSNSNNFAAGTVFGRITIGAANYTLSGNSVALTNGINASYASGNSFVEFPIVLQASQTFDVAQVSANLFFTEPLNLNHQTLTIDGPGLVVVQGPISNPFSFPQRGSLIKQGTGTLWLLSDPAYSIPTLVNGGSLLLGGSLSNSVITVNSGGTLSGAGTARGVTVNSGGTLQPGTSSPGQLTVLGNATINSGGTFAVRLNSASTYDRLLVNGDVTLGGSLQVTPGYTAAVGDRFTLIQNQGTNPVSGTFAGLPQGAVFNLNGRPFKITYGDTGIFGFRGNDVVLEAVPALSVWDGGGGLNSFWSEALNWVGDALPMPGDDIEFTNASSTRLVTTDDFPAGRSFGSMIFAGGNHRAQGGNLAVLNGSIQLTQPGNVVIDLPLSLAGGIRTVPSSSVSFSNSLSLAADQTFYAEIGSGSYGPIRLDGDVNVGSHTLVLDGPGNVIVEGSLSGPGQVVMNGSGAFWIAGTDGVATNIVNSGTIKPNGRVTGRIVVNPGARLEGGWLGPGNGVSDVEVHGGVLAPLQLVVNGSLSLLDGATFEWTSVDASGGNVFITSTNAVRLNNCNLALNFAPSIPIGRALEYPIIDGYGPAVSGTFNGLPGGTAFRYNNHSFLITYTNGVSLFADLPFVWSGNGPDANWTTATNWVADLAPFIGADLMFPGAAGKVIVTNDLSSATLLSSLQFTTNSYALYGNAFSLTNGIFNDASSGETLLAADVTLQGLHREVRVANASTLRMLGQLSGAQYSAWRKTGTGRLRLEGTNPNSDYNVDIWGGEVDLAQPAGVSAISGQVIVGDGTNIASLVLLADEQIQDSTTLQVKAPASFDLKGHAETMADLSGNGQVSLGTLFSPGQLTISHGSFSGAIAGFGGLVKTSPYILALSGINTFAGVTRIVGGLVQVDGIQTNSSVQLDGGVLSGQGYVGNITANLGGTLRPVGDVSVGFQKALHCRDVVLNSTTSFEPRVTSTSPGYEAFKLQVTGTVNLGGAALRVAVFYAFQPPIGSSYVIIDNDGTDAVVGTFAGLPEGAVFGSGGYPWRITYQGGDGNDVAVTRVGSPPATLSTVTLLTNGFVTVSGSGMENLRYSIQSATNLDAPTLWQTLTSGSADSNGLFQINVFDLTGLGAPAHFFRAVSP